MQQRRLAALVVAIASVVVPVLLGGFTARARPVGAATGSPPEACGLLRASDIARVLGQPAAKGTPGYAPGVCDWRLTATATRPAGTINALVERGRRARRSFALAAEFHATEREPIPGLGRKAFFAPSLGTVWVLSDRSTVFYVQGVYPRGSTDPVSLRAALIDLAEVARARA
jgi:hypothetical protein